MTESQMKPMKSLLGALLLFSLAALAGCGDDNGSGGTGSGSNGGGGSGGGVTGLAPTNLVGRTMTVSVTRSDSPPFAMASTSYNLRFNTATDYTYNGNHGGTYTYQRSGDIATLLLNDFGLQDNLTATVTFSTATSGTIHTRNSGGTASEDGSFSLTL
jgi:hypothetical protein